MYQFGSRCLLGILPEVQDAYDTDCVANPEGSSGRMEQIERRRYMIHTRFGSEIEILGMNKKGWCIVRRQHETTCHEWHASEFKFSKDDNIPDPISDEAYADLKADHILECLGNVGRG